MVTTEYGLELARLTLLDYQYNVLIDKYVKPRNDIINYNTIYSGITEELLENVDTDL